MTGPQLTAVPAAMPPASAPRVRSHPRYRFEDVGRNSERGADPDTARMIFGAACAAVLLAVVLAYANHFHNGLHFDDIHTVRDNPAIRSLANVPGFFADGRTFSVLPANASYRPLVSASLALDYWLGG